MYETEIENRNRQWKNKTNIQPNSETCDLLWQCGLYRDTTVISDSQTTTHST